jgi:SAM-dependent methyltransferase
MPAAADPQDNRFFEPLGDLRLHAETELHLGVLRPDEPVEQTMARIVAVHDLVGEFGLATICGWGRLAPATIPDLVDAHARCSRPVASHTHDRVRFAWPEGFSRVPDEEWVSRPVDSFGLQYDTVDNHGWYRNLDPTVEQLARNLAEGEILVDYSGGTGILLDRLLLRVFDRQLGMMIVDSSPKFLRVALERFRDDERVSFRRLHFLKHERRLELLEEVVDGIAADAIASTNAIHLYYDLEDTLRSWAAVLKPGGLVYINSGNIRNPAARSNEWILDETVYVIHEVATGIVRTDERWQRYRAVLDDPDRLGAYLEFRDRVFLAPRPLDHYLEALTAAGITVDHVDARTIEADVAEWFDFLSAYHDAVLGWVGGTEKLDGVAPTDEAVEDRLELIRRSLDVIFGGRDTFLACWTYIEGRRA